MSTQILSIMRLLLLNYMCTYLLLTLFSHISLISVIVSTRHTSSSHEAINSPRNGRSWIILLLMFNHRSRWRYQTSLRLHVVISITIVIWGIGHWNMVMVLMVMTHHGAADLIARLLLLMVWMVVLMMRCWLLLLGWTTWLQSLLIPGLRLGMVSLLDSWVMLVHTCSGVFARVMARMSAVGSVGTVRTCLLLRWDNLLTWMVSVGLVHQLVYLHIGHVVSVAHQVLALMEALSCLIHSLVVTMP